jgi:hypothetical protein
VTSGRILLSNGCYSPPVVTFSPINYRCVRCHLCPPVIDPEASFIAEECGNVVGPRDPSVLMRLRPVVRIPLTKSQTSPASRERSNHHCTRSSGSNEKSSKTTKDQPGRPPLQQQKQI